jgi:hypothetical protein
MRLDRELSDDETAVFYRRETLSLAPLSSFQIFGWKYREIRRRTRLSARLEGNVCSGSFCPVRHAARE